MKHLRQLLAAVLLCATTLPAIAASTPASAPAPAQAASDQPQQTAEQWLATLKPQHGNITLPSGIASLQLNSEFYYLSPDDTERLLTEAWGNPPGLKTLGMNIPTAVTHVAENGWGVIISYKNDGHISDDHAASIDYAELLEQMKADDAEDNKERRQQGYAGLTLLGWAEPPSYDQATHKMYWARELKADDAEQTTLNYSIRVLGREGVLELNAVAAMADLQTIKQETPKILAFTNFTDGNRYADYDARTDKLAPYGLAALVAGGIAGKAGLFAKIGVALLAFKKFIILGLVAIAGVLGKLFKRKQS